MTTATATATATVPGRMTTWFVRAGQVDLRDVRRLDANIPMADLADAFDVQTRTLKGWSTCGYLPLPYTMEGGGLRLFYSRQEVLDAIRQGRQQRQDN